MIDFNPDPPIDLGKLLGQCMGNARVVASVLDKLAQQLASELQAFEAPGAADDRDKLARAATTLKGAAGAVAATSLHDAAVALETAARSNEAALTSELARFKHEIERCAAYIPGASKAALSLQAA